MARVWLRLFAFAAVGCRLLACDSFSQVRERASGSGDPGACGGTPDETALDWEEASELGTPASVFDPIAGECEATLRWSRSSDAALGLDPERPSQMSVEVQLDRDSARLLQRTDARGRTAGCPAELEVDASVVLRSADGRIDAKADTKLRARQDEALTFSFTLAREDHRGSLMMRERKGETATLNFELDGAGSNCAGDIMLTTASMSADGKGVGAAERIAAWSASGCPAGQQSFDLSRDVGGGTLPELVTQAWSEQVFEGSWRDGAETQLTLHVEPLAEPACAEQRHDTTTVTLPVEAHYGTNDGRLEQRVAAASVRADLTESGELTRLALWISDELTCASTGSQLAYTQADCTQLKAATVQLGLNSSGEEGSAPTDGGLNVYFVQRFGDDPPKPDTLSLR